MLLAILNNNIINSCKIVIKHKDEVNVSIYKLFNYFLIIFTIFVYYIDIIKNKKKILKFLTLIQILSKLKEIIKINIWNRDIYANEYTYKNESKINFNYYAR